MTLGIGNETNLRPFSRDMSLVVMEGMPLFRLPDHLLELFRYIGSYGKFNLAEAGVFPYVIAIREEIVLVSCRVRAETDSLYLLGEEREGVRKNTTLLVAGRDVSVPELCVKDAPEFRPVGVEGLVRLVSLIAVRSR